MLQKKTTGLIGALGQMALAELKLGAPGRRWRLVHQRVVTTGQCGHGRNRRTRPASNGHDGRVCNWCNRRQEQLQRRRLGPRRTLASTQIGRSRQGESEGGTPVTGEDTSRRVFCWKVPMRGCYLQDLAADSGDRDNLQRLGSDWVRYP